MEGRVSGKSGALPVGIQEVLADCPDVVLTGEVVGNFLGLWLEPDLAMQNDSQFYLSLLAEQERLSSNRFAGVKTILVVLSSAAMAFDLDGLRARIYAAYPEAAVFFVTTEGRPMGATAQGHVDLVIDFTGPGQNQGWFYARKLRRMARFAVGRNAGFFRKRIYNRVVDERSPENARLRQMGTMAREREVQKGVLALAGIAATPHSESAPDRGKQIALELPPLARGL